MDTYQAELNKKVEILGRLLNGFDDGWRKNFFCLAVNLLELMDIKDVMAQLDEKITSDFILKEKAVLAVYLFQEIAYTQKMRTLIPVNRRVPNGTHGGVRGRLLR